MRYPRSTWWPGPSGKTYPEHNAIAGVVLHSMEGTVWGAFSEIENLSRQASWTFSIARTGIVYQHYGLAASCWANGNRVANTRYVAIEHEGRAGEPLTEAQVQSSVALVRWIAAQGGWAMERGVTLLEHNEVATRWEPNAGPTACPSGRIPWERYVPVPPPPVEEEPPVETRPLTTAQTLRLFEAIWRNTNRILNDDGVVPGTFVERGFAIESGFPAIPGNKYFIVALPDTEAEGI